MIGTIGASQPAGAHRRNPSVNYHFFARSTTTPVNLQNRFHLLETNESDSVESPPKPFTLDGVGMMRLARSSRKLGPVCAQKKGICDCGNHTPTPTRTFTPMQVQHSCVGPNFDERKKENHADTDDSRLYAPGHSATLMGSQCVQEVTGNNGLEPVGFPALLMVTRGRLQTDKNWTRPH